MAQPRAGGSPSPAEISNLRNATNLRTVSRNDPGVAEILDTSTYSVIYHYDEVAGKWAKQKQEGSIFVVRRTKAPEYALFMLNRVTVKNVTIPLIPGEMKATAIDASMLQVARRGEKIRYGIWFTEGTEGVQRFRDTIVGICGEPSKLGASSRASPAPGLLASTAANMVASSAGAAAPSTEDGFSRLFAGLTTIPAKAATPTSPPHQEPHPLQLPPVNQQPQQFLAGPPLAHVQQQPVSDQQAGGLPGMPAPYTQFQQFPQQPYPIQQSYPPQQPYPPQQQPYPPLYAHPQQPPPVPQHELAPAQPVAPPTAPEYPPGQTVDDLLMSILGVPGGSPAGAAARAPIPPQSLVQAPPQPPQPQPPVPTMSSQSPLSAPVTSSPVPKGPKGPVPLQARRVSRPQQAASPRQNGASGPTSPPVSSQAQSQAQSQPPGVAMRDALANTLPAGAPLGRIQLRDILTHLLSSDERFVDDVWRAYLARIGAPPPQ